MGGGTYSTFDRHTRALDEGYYTKSTQEIFKQRTINNAMNPHGIVVRESRDSAEHPKSLAIMLFLDVTGSMGSIPHFLVKQGLPAFVESIINAGIPDPQVLFAGIGDHECDDAPLQVGQFESSDELLDKWLTDLYLEGHGGGNYGESYLLAWYFAAKHTAIDCLEKRKQKGFLFTIGDEPTLNSIPGHSLKQIMGDGQYEDVAATILLDKAREKYNVYHLHLREGSNGTRQDVMDGWKQLMGKDLIIVERKETVADIMAETIVKSMVGKIEQPVPGEKPTETIL